MVQQLRCEPEGEGEEGGCVADEMNAAGLRVNPGSALSRPAVTHTARSFEARISMNVGEFTSVTPTVAC